MTKHIINALRWANAGFGFYNGAHTDNWADVYTSMGTLRIWARFDVHTGEIIDGHPSFPYSTLEAYLSAPVYLANAFSLQMLEGNSYTVEVGTVDELPLHLDSAIGHPDTAAVLGVPMNRANVSLKKGDSLYVAQLIGGRLPEGSTTLPEGFRFKFYRVYIR